MAKDLDVSKWPHYRTSRYVRAVKIAEVTALDDGSARIYPADDDVNPFNVPVTFMARHALEVGGYVIVYADGFMSWSPAGPFETSATRLENGGGANHRKSEAE